MLFLWVAAMTLTFLFVQFGPPVAVRKANIFLPFLAMIGSYGLISHVSKKVFVLSVLFYTFSLTLISQLYFVKDPRYAVSRFIQEKIEGRGLKVDYTEYARTKDMPSPDKGYSGNPDIIVMHETYYGRYWKSVSTPFKIPVCCREVWHCSVYEQCLSTQAIFGGLSPYFLLTKFEVNHPFPERIFFKKAFGNYETFLGDMLIYRKVL